MDANNLVDTYLRHCGLRRVKGDGYDVILPFFMLDAMYQILTKEIASIPCRQEQKLALKRWRASYNSFNHDFFSAFSQDQQDEVIDIMDNFTAHIGNDITVTQVSVMNQLCKHGIAFEGQKILASAMLCNILAQQADVIWEEVYKRHNRYIVAIERNSKIWMQSYFLQHYPGRVNPNDDKTICLAVDILCKKIVHFLDKI